jgi:hypothetical protein
MNSNFQLPKLRDPPRALPELSDAAYADIENAELLPGEEFHRNRKGTGTQYVEVAAQAPVAVDAFPAFQRPQSMEEVIIRKKQKEFAKLSEQLANGVYTISISTNKCPFKLI